VPYLTQDAIGSTLDYMASIQNSEVVFDYMEPPQAFSEEIREFVTVRTEQLKEMDERWASRVEPAGIAAILRSHGFVTSKTSISRRSRPGSAAPFRASRPDRLVFMLSTLSTSQAAKRGAHGKDISASKCSGCGSFGP